ncbi:MAG TPA: LysR family transcriptional regulator [Candidatus Dormibacteraeota bacterium]|nr:LysR family transcriptional regulator [Candidatus Dormibacteraeota bacterium]
MDVMELRNLSTFLTVAKTLSFTRAAEELNYAQSSVTAQVQTLEREIGAPLFERLGKRIVLTESGRRLVQYAERLVSLEREALACVPDVNEPVGTLTIGACEWLCADLLPRTLQNFRARYSKVQLAVKPDACDNLRGAVSAGVLDVAFLADARVKAPELVADFLQRESLIVIAAADHPLAQRRRIRPEELAGESFMILRLACTYLEALFKAMAAGGAAPGPMIEFGSVEAIKRCVAAGVGLAVTSRTAVRPELEHGSLAELRCSIPEFHQHVQLIRHRDKWLSPAMTAFIEVAKKEIAETAGLEGRDRRTA